MGREIRNQIRLQCRNWIWGYAVIFGMGIFGFVGMNVILYLEPGESEYAALGGIMAMFGLAFYCFGVFLVQFPFDFYTAVSMGRTRKRFLGAFYCSSFLWAFLGLGLALLVCSAEQAVYELLYPGFSRKVDMVESFWQYGAGGLIAWLAVLSLFAALSMKYGKKVLWILWAAWMIGCMGIPSILDAAAEAKDSLLGILGRKLLFAASALPASGWLAGGICVGILCMAFTLHMLVRQQIPAQT